METQCLADTHGNVVVVSTRDCSLQRRHQKLVEEAPAPFLSDGAERASCTPPPRPSCKEAGYVGAGTVEFLVGADGTISFLEVNTRLQVEHPVTEEVAGIDLVREMFRIADGEELGYDDPELRGHSFEFRINGEDPGRGFLPAPGTVTTLRPAVRPRRPPRRRRRVRQRHRPRLGLPARQADRHRRHPRTGPAARRPRPGRVRGRGHGHRHPLPPRGRHRPGVRPRTTGSTARSRSTPAGSRPSSSTRSRAFAAPADTEAEDEAGPRDVVVEVGGKRLEVSLPVSLGMSLARTGLAAGAKPKRRAAKKSGPAASGDTLASPMQGTIVKVAVEEGQEVKEGDLVVVLEAMKMEQPLNAHRSGTIKGLTAEVGASITSGATICEIKD